MSQICHEIELASVVKKLWIVGSIDLDQCVEVQLELVPELCCIQQ